MNLFVTSPRLLHARETCRLSRSLRIVDAIHSLRITSAPSLRCLLNCSFCGPLSRCKSCYEIYLRARVSCVGKQQGGQGKQSRHAPTAVVKTAVVQAHVRTGNRAYSSTGRYSSSIGRYSSTDSANVCIIYLLPVALVRTGAQPRLGFGNHTFVAAACTSTASHGVCASPIFALAHVFRKQQYDSKVNTCGQHCCTSTKLHADVWPKSTRHARQQGPDHVE